MVLRALSSLRADLAESGTQMVAESAAKPKPEIEQLQEIEKPVAKRSRSKK